MLYHISIYRTESQIIHIHAESPHEAVATARKERPGYQMDSVSEMLPDADGAPTDGEVIYDILGGCESCGRPILTGDQYYRWDDAVETCEKCGGGSAEHPLETAV